MTKKILKFGLILAVLVALVIGGLLWNTTPLLRRLKPQLESIAGKALGQNVELGELSLRFLPSVVIESSGATLAGSKPGEGASIRKIGLHAKLAPLLRGAVEISELTLDDLKVHVIRTHDGKLVVGGIPLGGGSSAQTPNAGEDTQQKGTEQNGAPLALSIRRTSLRNGSIVFRDEQVAGAPQEIRADDITIDLSDIAPDSIGSFRLSSTVLGTEKGNFTLSGALKLGKGRDGSPATSASPLPIPMSATGKVELKWNSLDLGKVHALANTYGKGVPSELTTSGNLSLALQGTFPAEDAPFLVLTLDATKAEIRQARVFTKSSGVPLRLEVTASAAGSDIAIPAASLTLAGSTISAKGTIAPLGGGLTMKVESSGVDLADVAKLLPAAAVYNPAGRLGLNLGLQPADVKHGGAAPLVDGTITLSDISLTVPTSEGTKSDGSKTEGSKPEGGASGLPITEMSGTIQCAQDTITIKPLSLTVAGQKLELGARVTTPSTPSVQFAVQGTKILLEPIGNGLAPGGIASLKDGELTGVKLTGTYSASEKKAGALLTLSSGTLAGLPVAASKLGVDMTLGPVSSAIIQPSTIGAFGGTIQLSGTIAQMRDLALSIQGAGLDLAKVTTFAGVEGVTGRLDSIRTSLRAVLPQAGKSLAGPFTIQASNGTLPGVNLLGQTMGAIKDIPGIGAALISYVPEKYRPILDANSTAYDRITVDGSLDGGSTVISSVVLDHQLYRVTGSGSFGRDGGMEFRAQMRIAPVLVEGMIRKESKLSFLSDRDKGLIVPLMIKKSPGGHTIVIPDVSELGKRALTGIGKDQGKKVLEKLAPGLGGALDSLF